MFSDYAQNKIINFLFGKGGNVPPTRSLDLDNLTNKIIEAKNPVQTITSINDARLVWHDTTAGTTCELTGSWTVTSSDIGSLVGTHELEMQVFAKDYQRINIGNMTTPKLFIEGVEFPVTSWQVNYDPVSDRYKVKVSVQEGLPRPAEPKFKGKLTNPEPYSGELCIWLNPGTPRREVVNILSHEDAKGELRSFTTDTEGSDKILFESKLLKLPGLTTLYAVFEGEPALLYPSAPTNPGAGEYEFTVHVTKVAQLFTSQIRSCTLKTLKPGWMQMSAGVQGDFICVKLEPNFKEIGVGQTREVWRTGEKVELAGETTGHGVVVGIHTEITGVPHIVVSILPTMLNIVQISSHPDDIYGNVTNGKFGDDTIYVDLQDSPSIILEADHKLKIRNERKGFWNVYEAENTFARKDRLKLNLLSGKPVTLTSEIDRLTKILAGLPDNNLAKGMTSLMVEFKKTILDLEAKQEASMRSTEFFLKKVGEQAFQLKQLEDQMVVLKELIDPDLTNDLA